MLAVRPVTSLLLAASLGASATAAKACVVFRDFDETAFLEADLIFIGDLTDYNIVTVQGEFHDTELAVLTYRVDQVLKGEAGDKIRLQWPNSTFQLPDSMKRIDATLVAAVPGEAPEADWTGWLRYPSTNGLTSLPMLHQRPCTSPSIMSVAPRDVAMIERWIAGEAADAAQLSTDGIKIAGEVPARRTGQLNLLPIGSGAVGVALATLAINRRQRRRKRDRAPAG